MATNLTSLQLLTGNHDFRRTLSDHIRNHFHGFGRQPGTADNNLKLSDKALQFVTGIMPSMNMGRFISRVKANNVPEEYSSPMSLIADEVRMCGMRFVPDRYKNVAELFGLSKCLQLTTAAFETSYNRADILTSGILQDFLNHFCMCMYTQGVLSNLREMAKILDLATEYMADIIWYMSEPKEDVDSKKLMSSHLITLYTSGTSIESLHYVNRDVSGMEMNSLDANSTSMFPESDSGPYRWYSKPLEFLIDKLGLMVAAAKGCDAACLPCGREVFPQSCRVSYSGDWIMNECQGTPFRCKRTRHHIPLVQICQCAQCESQHGVLRHTRHVHSPVHLLL